MKAYRHEDEQFIQNEYQLIEKNKFSTSKPFLLYKSQNSFSVIKRGIKYIAHNQFTEQNIYRPWQKYNEDDEFKTYIFPKPIYSTDITKKDIEKLAPKSQFEFEAKSKIIKSHNKLSEDLERTYSESLTDYEHQLESLQGFFENAIPSYLQNFIQRNEDPKVQKYEYQKISEAINLKEICKQCSDSLDLKTRTESLIKKLDFFKEMTPVEFESFEKEKLEIMEKVILQIQPLKEKLCENCSDEYVTLIKEFGEKLDKITINSHWNTNFLEYQRKKYIYYRQAFQDEVIYPYHGILEGKIRNIYESLVFQTENSQEAWSKYDNLYYFPRKNQAINVEYEKQQVGRDEDYFDSLLQNESDLEYQWPELEDSQIEYLEELWLSEQSFELQNPHPRQSVRYLKSFIRKKIESQYVQSLEYHHYIEFFKKQKGIKEFIFSDYKYNLKGLGGLHEILGSFKELEIINIDLSSINFQDCSQIQCFFHALRSSLKKIIHFSLTSSSSSFKPANSEIFIECTSNLLKQLKNAQTVEINQFSISNSASFINLFSPLKQLGKIQDLSLNLIEFSSYESQYQRKRGNLVSMSEQIELLQSLSNLKSHLGKLQFSAHSIVAHTDKGIMQLLSLFLGVSYLKTLDLSLHYFEEAFKSEDLVDDSLEDNENSSCDNLFKQSSLDGKLFEVNSQDEDLQDSENEIDLFKIKDQSNESLKNDQKIMKMEETKNLMQNHIDKMQEYLDQPQSNNQIYFPNLKEFFFQYSYCLSNEEFYALFKFIEKKSPNLELIHLNCKAIEFGEMEFMEVLDKTKIWPQITRSLENMPNLKVLHLEISANETINTFQFFDNLRQSTKLEQIILLFNGIQIGLECLHDIIHALSQMSSLKLLNFQYQLKSIFIKFKELPKNSSIQDKNLIEQTNELLQINQELWMPLTLLDNSESLEEVNIRFNNFIFTGIPLKCKLIGLSPEEQKELF